jgi:hypothetical protein
MIELGFGAAWQDAWDVLYQRVGCPQRRDVRRGNPTFARFARRYANVLVRPEHGGLPWKGWCGSVATRRPRRRCILASR